MFRSLFEPNRGISLSPMEPMREIDDCASVRGKRSTGVMSANEVRTANCEFLKEISEAMQLGIAFGTR